MKRARKTAPPPDKSETNAIRAPHHRVMRLTTRPNATAQTRTTHLPVEARHKRKREEQSPEPPPQQNEPEAYPPEGVG